MDDLATPDQLTAALHDAAITHGSVLFAGAGVGCRAGLPDWDQFVNSLACVADSYDPDTAALMRKRLAEGLHLIALDLFRLSPSIPHAKRWDARGAPFASGSYDARKLGPLVSLPFDAIVTTNFDRSLHDAFSRAHGRTAFAAELGDPSLKRALYSWKDPYIARIHGRAEVPQTMVIDGDDYKRTEADGDYIDFLIHVLTRKRCVFVGFSFVDPAISRVLQVVDDRVASAFPQEHLALVPSSARNLRTRLARYNIRVLLYDDAGAHASLWDAVDAAARLHRAGPAKPRTPFPTPLEPAHRLLAMSYARSEMAREVSPLRATILEGLALGLLVEEGGLTRLELAERVRRIAPMTSSEAASAIGPAIERLAADGVVREESRRITVIQAPENRMKPDLERLVVGVTNRMKVRSGLESSAAHQSAVGAVLECLVLSRGWDLAASLCSAKRSDQFDVQAATEAAFQRFESQIPAQHREATREAVRDLLERPAAHEAGILTRLARLSFGAEIALERGRSTFAHSLTLPQRVYLDASVLLPAITPGHPYRPMYVAAVRRLQEAASKAGLSAAVLVLEPFLNEIVSHRANAIAMVERGDLEDPRRLERLISLTRADYTNVFVGGYSSQVGRAKQALSFRQYLRDVAPYETESELAQFLAKQGIETVPEKSGDPKERAYMATFDTELYAAYASEASDGRPAKAAVLIRHEARQLARLMREMEGGTRSVFVTADNRLRRHAAGESLGRVAASLFSHTGLLQLIDLLVGLDADDESFSRLLWAVEARDERDALRGYFVDLALRRYDAAMAMSMPKVIETIVEGTLEAAKREGVKLAFPEAGEEIKRTFAFLDRFEEQFYENMAAEMRKGT